jgi:GGDEF domain-containing protein
LRLPRLVPRFGHNRDRDALIKKATREAESGRRLAMYDRETGLYAHWYLAQRFEEEAKRSERYSRPLSVILVEVRSDDAYRVQDEVRNWIAKSLRSTDMATHLGAGRYLALLTETPLTDAAAIAARLAESFPKNIAIGLGFCPDDGTSLEEVQTVAQRRAHGNWALAI